MGNLPRPALAVAWWAQLLGRARLHRGGLPCQDRQQICYAGNIRMARSAALRAYNLSSRAPI